MQHLHAAHRSADDAEQRFDPEPVEQHGLRADHVGDGDDGKSSPHSLPVAGLVEAGPVDPMQPPITFAADDEISVGIERTAGTDHDFPPAGLAGQRMRIGDVLVEGQRVADQDGVGTIRVELAIGLIGDLERRQIDAAIEPQGLVRAEFHYLRSRMIGLLRAILAVDRRTGYRWYVGHIGTDLLAEALQTEIRP